MATTYTWAIVQMDASPEVDGNINAVSNVHWTLTGEEAGFTGYVYGTQSVSVNPDVPFTPYGDLTEAQVIGWVQDAIGTEQVESYKANITQQINNQIIPPVVAPPFPWSA